MTTVNIHEAKTHLSKLLARVLAGEEIVIARAGKPVARVLPYEDALAMPKKRIGFLKDAGFNVPDNFDEIGRQEIDAMFIGKM